MLRNLGEKFVAILGWILVCGAAFGILMTGANLWQLFAVVTIHINPWAIQVVRQVYYVITGLAWLGLMVWVEHLLVDTGTRTGLLWKRLLLLIGIEIVVLCLVQIGIMLYPPVNWGLVALVFLGVLLGAGLIYISRRVKKSPPRRPVIG